MFGSEVPSVTVPDVADDAWLLDVREADEWAAGHAPGAHHLPMTELPSRLADVPLDGEVVVVCRSGRRSAQVVAYLIQRGWENVRNLDGGMQEWAAAGRPLTNESGTPPRVI
ncbi:MAG TPA: rhodanese-like domain-containing protein [Micromonosporaceae bacterium]